MKRIVLLLFFLVVEMQSFAQNQGVVPMLKNADQVFIGSHKGNYVYWDSLGNQVSRPEVILKGKINDAVIVEKKALNQAQILELIRILEINKEAEAVAECFNPHHFILIVKKGKQSYINMCFECRTFETSKDITGLKIGNAEWNKLSSFFYAKGMRYKLKK